MAVKHGVSCNEADEITLRTELGKPGVDSIIITANSLPPVVSSLALLSQTICHRNVKRLPFPGAIKGHKWWHIFFSDIATDQDTLSHPSLYS